MADLIDRQAAIDELYKMLHDCFWADDEELDAVIITLNELPSAQPERTGKWIRISPAKIYECSICGKNVMTADIDEYHFCYGCGARMEGE